MNRYSREESVISKTDPYFALVGRIDFLSKHYLAPSPSSGFGLSIDSEEELVSLSLLSEDTGKSDILPESLGLPLRLIGKEKKCNTEKKNKRKLSESEQVINGLAHLHASLFCFRTRWTDWRVLSFSSPF